MRRGDWSRGRFGIRTRASGKRLGIFGMVGLQFTPIMESLGSMMNGIVNYNTYVPGMNYPGIQEYFERYSKRAAAAKVDPLGYYITPFNYAKGRIYERTQVAAVYNEADEA